ncbi:hypothetical protein IAQ61_002677 [Plenodomus lingam]|uniref:Uncharacterized protein n=1 Tax=Leptosphaeria maculans (strain JN3 / isolate v23.1.3 / race Av1-4-5-6-7-8) TaxID=985895 RepID=E5A933_LEPMJ|nr:hypothetical protein LEMA_P077170.1 [Plenodomus lingam JN3]KAH9877313.1 hypothetical protein IAQ61_002677 [Plenodomus lingam]CBY00128.1 hypothetical protein LEMA_P077170.1 [Plenodomus lingam JN3]
MPFRLATITLMLTYGINLTNAAHAGFHVQFPWLSRGPKPKIQTDFDPFCGEIIHNPGKYDHRSRTFLSFSGHPGDLVTTLYTRNRVPRKRDDFPHVILQDVPIATSGQLCVNVTIPFPTELDEMGVMYFEARDPKTGNVEHYCSDVRMVDMTALPEEHPAMCAADNKTLIPMPDEYL